MWLSLNVRLSRGKEVKKQNRMRANGKLEPKAFAFRAFIVNKRAFGA